MPHLESSVFLLVFVLQLEKGKLRGSIDMGLSVMAIKKKSMRIDLDTEDNIYHLKVKEDKKERVIQISHRMLTLKFMCLCPSA